MVDLNPGAGDFPPHVLAAFAAHHALYHSDPVAAHLWDPAVIGVPGGPVPCLLLFHRGRRSRAVLETILQYYRRDGELAIVASKGGMPAHPAWYLNLLAEPRCEVQIAEERLAVRARTVTGAARAPWWEFITREQPQQRLYEARTTREIPVVVLELAEAPPA